MSNKIRNKKMMITKLKHNSPVIKTSVGVGGVLTTTGLAIAATPKAHERMMQILDEHKGNKRAIIRDSARHVLPLYIPTIISGGLTIYCILSSHNEMAKRSVALAGLYASSETALKAYQHKVAERMGEKWHNETLHEANKDIINSRPSTIITGPGKIQCYDKPSDRYFSSDMQTIRKAENDVNKECIDQQYCGLNDFYTMIGLNYSPAANGRGWTAGDGYLNIKYDAQLNESDEPVLVIDYESFPLL